MIIYRKKCPQTSKFVLCPRRLFIKIAAVNLVAGQARGRETFIEIKMTKMQRFSFTFSSDMMMNATFLILTKRVMIVCAARFFYCMYVKHHS